MFSVRVSCPLSVHNFCFWFKSAAHFRYSSICQFHPKILEELDITYYYGTQMPGDRWNNVTCAYCKEKFKNDKSQISCQTSQGNQMFKNPWNFYLTSQSREEAKDFGQGISLQILWQEIWFSRQYGQACPWSSQETQTVIEFWNTFEHWTFWH